MNRSGRIINQNKKVLLYIEDVLTGAGKFGIIFHSSSLKEKIEMTNGKKIEVVHGTGNVFRDTGFPNPDIEQTKASISAQIIMELDKQGLSTRKAQALTGFDASDLTRVRNADLSRFTIDRLMKILKKLNPEIEMKLEFKAGSKRQDI